MAHGVDVHSTNGSAAVGFSRASPSSVLVAPPPGARSSSADRRTDTAPLFERREPHEHLTADVRRETGPDFTRESQLAPLRNRATSQGVDAMRSGAISADDEFLLAMSFGLAQSGLRWPGTCREALRLAMMPSSPRLVTASVTSCAVPCNSADGGMPDWWHRGQLRPPLLDAVPVDPHHRDAADRTRTTRLCARHVHFDAGAPETTGVRSHRPRRSHRPPRPAVPGAGGPLRPRRDTHRSDPFHSGIESGAAPCP